MQFPIWGLAKTGAKFLVVLFLLSLAEGQFGMVRALYA